MYKIHYYNVTESCFFQSMAKQCLTRKSIVCRVTCMYISLLEDVVTQTRSNNNFSKDGGIGKRIPRSKKNKYTTIKRCKKVNFQVESNGKWTRSKDAEGGWNSNPRKNIICNVLEARESSGGKALTDVEVIRRNEAKITKKEDSQEYSNFRTPPQKMFIA